MVRFLLNISFIAFQLNPQKYWGYKVVFINIFIRKHGSSSYDPCRMTLLVNTGMVLNKTIFKQKKKEIFIKTNLCVLSGVGLFTAPWIVAHQAPLSMGLSCVEAKERS